jgi:hypothetical protein
MLRASSSAACNLLSAILLQTALGIAPTVAPTYGNAKCRIHNDAASTQASYRWRNAYTPSHIVEEFPLKTLHSRGPGVSRGSGFDTHEYAYCSGGKGPWAFSANNLSVSECLAKCAEINCTCMDYMCAYHEAVSLSATSSPAHTICRQANCTCPTVQPAVPAPNATTVACVGDSITAGYLSSCGLTYPAQLQQLLGSKYKVQNYGAGGTTML